MINFYCAQRRINSRKLQTADISSHTKGLILIRPPVRSNETSYKMLVMFCVFFLSPRVLRGPSADRPETWPHDRKLSEFYNPSPKIRGALPPKKFGDQKHAKFRSILYNLRLWLRMSPERLKISIANFSRSIPPAFCEKGPVNFGPQITEILMWVRTH